MASGFQLPPLYRIDSTGKEIFWLITFDGNEVITYSGEPGNFSTSRRAVQPLPGTSLTDQALTESRTEWQRKIDTEGYYSKEQDITFTPDMINENTIIATANKINKGSFENLLRLLGNAYHNDQALISDEKYDELVDIYEAKYGPYSVVGAEPTGAKVELPYYLGSLRKLKEEEELMLWLRQHPGPYIIEDKIDGLTLLLVSKTVNGRRQTSLYTRGGGYRGLDVSHLLQYIPFPPITEDISVRGEVVLTKEAFARVGAGFKNARNLVSGIVNAKKSFNPTIARTMSFYAYRILNKNNTPEQDVMELMSMGFSVPFPSVASILTKKILENHYEQRKQAAPYEMDGLVIYQNIAAEYPVGETPKHVVAFKTGSETAITTVTRVEWNASKDFLLKPIVHYEPIVLSGAELSKASGYNARFILSNGIGPGAQILITRSGDVIPKILSVITPATEIPWPDPTVFGEYRWNENQVELVTTELTSDVLERKLKHFIDTLDIKNMGPGRIKLLVNAGIRDIAALLAVTPQQLTTIQGIGAGISNSFYTDLHTKITNVPLAKIMDASGIFPGIGEKRFEMIIAAYPNFLDMAYDDPTEIAERIRQVKGFKSLADVIAGRMRDFADWLKAHPSILVAAPGMISPRFVPSGATTPTSGATTPVTQNLTGVTVVFSGFRDKAMEDEIKARGGRVTTSVSRNTSFVVMRDIADKKGKALEAEQRGVPLITREEFSQRYLS